MLMINGCEKKLSNKKSEARKEKQVKSLGGGWYEVDGKKVHGKKSADKLKDEAGKP